MKGFKPNGEFQRKLVQGVLFYSGEMPGQVEETEQAQTLGNEQSFILQNCTLVEQEEENSKEELTIN